MLYTKTRQLKDKISIRSDKAKNLAGSNLQQPHVFSCFRDDGTGMDSRMMSRAPTSRGRLGHRATNNSQGGWAVKSVVSGGLLWAVGSGWRGTAFSKGGH